MIAFGSPCPVLRIFDEPAARDFYLRYLGFAVDWEHRFYHGTPLYMQISRDTLSLHLSGHSGDARPGARCSFPATGSTAFLRNC